MADMLTPQERERIYQMALQQAQAEKITQALDDLDRWPYRRARTLMADGIVRLPLPSRFIVNA